MKVKKKIKLLQLGECYCCGRLSESMSDPKGDLYFCTASCREKYGKKFVFAE